MRDHTKRRAAVSIASNIVEGAARNSLEEYLRFLDMVYGSAKEVGHQLSRSGLTPLASGLLQA